MANNFNFFPPYTVPMVMEQRLLLELRLIATSTHGHIKFAIIKHYQSLFEGYVWIRKTNTDVKF